MKQRNLNTVFGNISKTLDRVTYIEYFKHTITYERRCLNTYKYIKHCYYPIKKVTLVQ